MEELDELAETFEQHIEGLGDDVRERVLKLIAAGKNSYDNVSDQAAAAVH